MCKNVKSLRLHWTKRTRGAKFAPLAAYPCLPETAAIVQPTLDLVLRLLQRLRHRYGAFQDCRPRLIAPDIVEVALLDERGRRVGDRRHRLIDAGVLVVLGRDRFAAQVRRIASAALRDPDLLQVSNHRVLDEFPAALGVFRL